MVKELMAKGKRSRLMDLTFDRDHSLHPCTASLNRQVGVAVPPYPGTIVRLSRTGTPDQLKGGTSDHPSDDRPEVAN